MFFRGLQQSTLHKGLAAFALAVGVSSPAFAGEIVPPDLHFTFQVGDADPIPFYPQGVQTGPTSWNWQGGYEDPAGEWSMPFFSIDANTDPFINMFFGLQNNTLSTQTYTLAISLPVIAIPGGTLIDGSMGGSVTDASGDGFAEVAALPGESIYLGLIDNASVATLLGGGYTAFTNVNGGTAAIGPASFGQPNPIGGPPVSTDVGLVLRFMLTPGDSVSMTAFFRVEPVPAPGGLALLALGAIATRRRRRH